MRTLRHNKTFAFCPGAIIDGIPQPFVRGAGEVTSPLCSSISLSIATPKVFHNALYTGSSSAKNFGLHTFPKFVLFQLKTAQVAAWTALFRLLISALAGAEPTHGPLPKNLTIRFGAHHASVYSTTTATKTLALTTSVKD